MVQQNSFSKKHSQDGVNRRISIILSVEHSRYIPDIEECFKELDISAQATYMRCSEGELPMQILIFVGGAIAGGAVYDLLKLGIKNVFKKFKNARILIRDKNSINYSIDAEGNAHACLLRENQKGYDHIKTIDDVIFHIKKIS